MIGEALMLGPLPPGFQAEANLFEALGLDSVDALEIVMEVERQFGVQIKDDEASRAILQSVRSLAAHVAANS